MRLQLLTLLSSLASLAFADVEFTVPAAGASVAGGGAITITWKDSGTAPAISTFSTYTLALYAGGNNPPTNGQPLYTFTTAGAFSAGNTYQATIAAGLGGSTANAYYLQMISVSKEGGTVINYSSHFTLTGMTGTFNPVVTEGIESLAGTLDGPPTVNDVNTGSTGVAAGAAQFTVPFHLQTGLTKYAPMQPVPPTSITAQSYTPLNPTSAYSLATTFLAIPTVLTTLTESQTFSVSSMENTAAAASNPTGDMQKFLNRWKD